MFTFVLLRVLAVLLLVAANAFFVAAEFSLVSIRDTRIEQLIEAKRIGARTIRKLHRKLDEVLNGVQLGVTMASLALGWLGESALARVLEQPLGELPHAAVYAHAISIAVAFGLITYFHVILGEVVPKSVSLQQAERVALAVAKPLDVFMTVFSPLLKFMARSSRLVLRIFGTRELRAGGVHSAEELKMIVTASRRFGLIPHRTGGDDSPRSRSGERHRARGDGAANRYFFASRRYAAGRGHEARGGRTALARACLRPAARDRGDYRSALFQGPDALDAVSPDAR